MNHSPQYPSMYQINTRVWLTELSRKLGRPATLDDIPEAELDQLAGQKFDWIWLLSVWQTGTAAQRISRTNPEWLSEFKNTLPDLTEDDIGGSGFAITGYTVHKNLGGDAALARLRDRLRKRGFRLLLDFVPNHMALDHPWVNEHPDYFVAGTELQLAQAPKNYTRVPGKQGNLLLAHGRDPYFPGWPDTLQLNYANPATQAAMREELTRIAGQCDGVRCDMAMLVLPDVFERTWGLKSEHFWPKAIEDVRSRNPNFCFMAEVYWDLEWTLQQQGFNYTYDKRLYDRLEHRQARSAREHLQGELGYQKKMIRFLENHDEPRAATIFPLEVHEAAAIITFFSPGLRFFHAGQFEGFQKRISPHLIRGAQEPVNPAIECFYQRLMKVLQNPVVRDGDWQLLTCSSAWQDNQTYDSFIAYGWTGHGDETMVIAVNFSAHSGQCYVKFPWERLRGASWRLKDLMTSASYDRQGDELASQGLYLDIAPWQYHVFALSKI